MAATIPERYETPAATDFEQRPRPPQPGPWPPCWPPLVTPEPAPAPAPEPAPGPAPQPSGGGTPSRKWIVVALLGSALLGGASGGLVSLAVSENTSNSSGTAAVATGPVAGTLAQAAAAALPSVVSIKVVTFDETDEGSGVVIDAGGLILTNNHVIALAASGGAISVTFSSGKSVAATLVGRSVTKDVAVVRVRGVSGLKPAVLSTGTLVVGQQVLAIGNSLGLSESVSSGIVSGTDRDLTVSTGENQFGDASTEQLSGTVQTDAAINPGNSGGALVDIDGRVIGLVTAAASLSSSSSGSIGVGFAIPIGDAMAVAKTLAGEL